MPPKTKQVFSTLKPVRLPEHRNPVKLYLSSLAEVGERSRRTMLARMARMFSDGLCTENTLPWWQLDSGAVLALRNWLVANYKPQYGRMHLQTLSRVLRECVRLNLLDGDQARRITDVPEIVGESLPAGRHVKRDELAPLFAYLAEQNTATTLRDRALIAVLYATGMRRIEAVRLRVEDYNEQEPSLHVQGKGHRERKVYLPNWTVECVKGWLWHRGHGSGVLLCPTDMFGNVYPKRYLDLNQVNKNFRSYQKKLKMKHFSPHDLRRTHIGDRLEEGHDILKVSKAVGHRDVKMTAHYDRRPEEARRAMGASIPSPLA